MAEDISPEFELFLNGEMSIKDITKFLNNLSQEQFFYLVANLTNPQTITLLFELATANNSKAKEVLGGLEKPTARAVLADRAVESGDKILLEVCQKAGHTPLEPSKQVVFYALTGQFADLDKLDPDSSLLAEKFNEGSKVLQHRIMESFRKAGRGEAFKKLKIFDRAKKAKNPKIAIPEKNFHHKIENLKNAEKWQELWELVSYFSPSWSQLILTLLADSGWQPTNKADLPLFEKLVALAKKFSETEDFSFLTSFPFSSVKKEPLEYPDSDATLSLDGNYTAKFSQYGSFRVFSILENKVIFERSVQDLLEDGNTNFFSTSTDVDMEYLKAEFIQPAQPVIGDYYTGNTLNTGQNWLWFSYNILFWLFWKLEDGSYYIECGEFGDKEKPVIWLENNNWLVTEYDYYDQLDRQRWFELRNAKTKELISKSAFFEEHSQGYAIRPDGKQIAEVFSSGEISLLNLPDFTTQEVETWGEYVKNVIYSPDGKLLVIGQPLLQFWDVENGTITDEFSNTEMKSVSGQMLFRPDGEALFFDSGYKKLEMLTKAGQAFPLYNAETWLEQLAFTPDGRQLRIMSEDGEIFTWSSLPIYMYLQPVEKSNYLDFLQIQQLASDKTLPRDGRLWLKFIELCHALRWRYEVQIETIAEVVPTALDIELENEEA